MIYLSVGIPAHNEGKNIVSLITSIINQKSTNYNLKEIIIALDGCTDNTKEEVESIRDQRIVIINDNHRYGKAKRLNQIYNRMKGNYLIQLDGDVKIFDTQLFERIVDSFNHNSAIDVIYGRQRPVAPNTFVGKLALFGFDSWEITKKCHKGDVSRYNCFANLTVFSKKFLDVYRLPEGRYVTDDTYSFYFAKSNNFKTQYLEVAEVFFNLPQTIEDYTNQMSRYLSTSDEMKKTFSEALINKYETIKNVDRINGLIRNTRLANVHIVISYILLQLIPKIQNALSNQKREWVIIESSK